MPSTYLTSFLLRLALAIPLLYAAIAAFLDPTSWIGFLPPWIQGQTLRETLLMLFSLSEIILALWLISGWRAFESASITAFVMFAITVANMGAFDIIFRDIGLLLAAIALMSLHKKST